jgi:hypothetical protein
MPCPTCTSSLRPSRGLTGALAGSRPHKKQIQRGGGGGFPSPASEWGCRCGHTLPRTSPASRRPASSWPGKSGITSTPRTQSYARARNPRPTPRRPKRGFPVTPPPPPPPPQKQSADAWCTRPVPCAVRPCPYPVPTALCPLPRTQSPFELIAAAVA